MTAPLILAIEPDRQQAAQLALIAGRLSVELVLMDTTALALVVLRERLPYLVPPGCRDRHPVAQGRPRTHRGAARAR